MYTSIIGTQQILITAAFLSVMILLLIILRKKSTVIRASMRAGKRINIIEDTVISPNERLRLLRVDSTNFIMISAKGYPPSLICLKTAEETPTKQKTNDKNLFDDGDGMKSFLADEVETRSLEKSTNDDRLSLSGAPLTNPDDEQQAFAEKFRSWRQQNDVR